MINFINIKTIYAVDDYLLGDVNNDGVVNKHDAYLVAKYVVNGESSSGDTFISSAADVNLDGKIKMNDALLLVKSNNSQQLATKITLDVDTINLMNGKSITIKGNVLPFNARNKTIAWKSSNDDVATVDSQGKVTAKKPGVVTITASTDNNIESKATVIVNKYNIYDSYESSTLKYYIERPNNNYIITRVWVSDAYNQMKVAITNEVNSNIAPVKTWSDSYASQWNRANEINECINDPNRDYPVYNVMDADKLFENEITKQKYVNKGIYAVNCSPMISTYWSTDAPCDWFGMARMPIVIVDGKVIRDSTNKKLYSNTSVLGLTKNNEIKVYSFKKGSTEDEIKQNKATVANIKNDGVKYTFVMFSNLVQNYTVKATSTANNIRTSFCQIDANNYILVSSTLSSTSQDNRTYNGLSYKGIAEEMVEYGCKSGYSFDGGGSQVYYYMKNDNKYTYIHPRSYDGRGLADIFYFVEK